MILYICQKKQIKMKTTEQKRKYEKPAMQVYELEQQPQLLAGSGFNDPDDYPGGGNPFTY